VNNEIRLRLYIGEQSAKRRNHLPILDWHNRRSRNRYRELRSDGDAIKSADTGYNSRRHAEHTPQQKTFSETYAGPFSPMSERLLKTPTKKQAEGARKTWPPPLFENRYCVTLGPA
jgi:hypothetical protein